jgi:(1->4)-alpha-D-glucan 1-alpha-D-glucosylmutase
MRVPSATYRLQVNDGFTLDDASGIVPYLARLGISDLYLSPIFEARRGSVHGYDVTDPTRIRASIGGMEGLRRLAGATQAHGLGLIIDIVPNHMAASAENPWWRDVLARGRNSACAHYFDIDWGPATSPARLRLPILGDSLDALLGSGQVAIDETRREVVCHGARLPLRAGSMDVESPTAGSSASDVRAILDRQHYELVHWREAAESMNYRRFFDITDLVGVRVENGDVFRATHALVHELAADGLVTGLRIDHVDGLRDPTGYLEQLRSHVRTPDGSPLYTVVEKILEHDERLPRDWACEGTTGYEFLSVATGAFIDADGHHRLEEFYRRITADQRSFDELVREKKLLVMDRLFRGELNGLARTLADLLRVGRAEACDALAEVTASMRVYRTYTRSSRVRRSDRARIQTAVHAAATRRPDLAASLAALQDLLLMEFEADQIDGAAALDFVMRWQQFSGPVMAKGFEDTALYCHNALLAANDVGTNPMHPAWSTDEIHAAFAERAAHRPIGMNATATHDTKRGEDTRARIAVISELAEDWRSRLRRWMREGEEWKADAAPDEDTPEPGADVDSLLYQTLVGAWPPGGPGPDFLARIQAYMTKAVREAKEQTSWRRPDEDFEQALSGYIDKLMADVGRVGLIEEVEDFVGRTEPHGVLNSIAQLLLKTTAPGIPDIYQGTELWSFTLVDPDNRQQVDFEERRRLLDDIAHLLDVPDPAAIRALLVEWRDGRIKLLLTAAALRVRVRHAAVFRGGSYVPLRVTGPRAGHVIAFARQAGTRACITVVPRLTARLGAPAASPSITAAAWTDTVVELPARLPRAWHNSLTGESLPGAESLELAQLFATLPFALLHGSQPIGG